MEITIIDKTKKVPVILKCYKHALERRKYENFDKAPAIPLAEFYVTRELKDGTSISVPLCGDCVQELCTVLDHKVAAAAILEQELSSK